MRIAQFDVTEAYSIISTLVSTKQRHLLMEYGFDFSSNKAMDKIVTLAIRHNLSKSSGISASENYVDEASPNDHVLAEIAIWYNQYVSSVNRLLTKCTMAPVINYDYLWVKYPGVLWIGWDNEK